MSKKSSKTSHVLNLITSRIKVGEDGSTIESDSLLITVSHVDHLNIDSAMVNTTFFPDEISQSQLDQFLNGDDDDEEEETADFLPARPQLEIGPWGPKPAPTAEEIAAQSGTASDVSAGNPQDTARASQPDSNSGLPVNPADLDAVSDLIRQQLEEHLEASITPMTVQDFGDPRQRRNVELPISGGGLKNMDNTDYVVDNEEYMYVNIMEELVLQEMEDLMDKIGVCTCKRCRNDIMALALNRLPSKYVVTHKGYLLSKLNSYDGQYHADVMSAVTSACLQVKERPNHE